MMETMPGLGERVVTVRASGKVTAEDYQQVLVPAVEAATQDGKRARLLYVLGPDYDGFELGAILRDAKVGLGHLTDFERIAVVTDRDWIANSPRATAFLIPARIELFTPDQLEEAKRWIAEPTPDPLVIETLLEGDTALRATWQKRLVGTARAALGLPVRFFEEAELAEAEAWVRAATSERARL